MDRNISWHIRAQRRQDWLHVQTKKFWASVSVCKRDIQSRVLKTFLVQTLNGINNYVFSKDDKRLMLPHENITQMSFWLKFNTGELITPGYPITLDLRIE